MERITKEKLRDALISGTASGISRDVFFAMLIAVRNAFSSGIGLGGSDIDWAIDEAMKAKAPVLTAKIAVIEIKDSVLHEMHWCATSEEAEAKFLELCRENITNFEEYTADDIEAILENGYEQYGSTNSICIHHL